MTRSSRMYACLGATVAVLLAGCGGGGGGSGSFTPPDPTEPPSGLTVGPAGCVGGTASDFACLAIDLARRIPLDAMGGGEGNDLWGWVDPENGDEYALMGMSNGTAFVDVTDPASPVFLGTLPTQTIDSPWRDIKVFEDHAYIVADSAGPHGMQVFDLTRLRGVTAPQTWTPDAVYDGFASAHNLAINELTGFAYAVGTDTCNEGLHIINITVPTDPQWEGCHPDFHTHDTQCVSYTGPDEDYAGREICVSSAEDVVEIADVTDKAVLFTVSVTAYPELGFVHQAWLTGDHRFLLVGDEFDERRFGVPTRTHVIDVSDLDNPAYLYPYELPTTSVDHNLYVSGNRVYEANYTSGLRVLEFGDLANGEIAEIAFFDTFPDGDGTEFDGAWSVYPFLPSGTILVSDISHGLFLLTLQP